MYALRPLVEQSKAQIDYVLGIEEYVEALVIGAPPKLSRTTGDFNDVMYSTSTVVS